MSQDPVALDMVKTLGYTAAPVVVSGEDHWSGFRMDRIQSLSALSGNRNVRRRLFFFGFGEHQAICRETRIRKYSNSPSKHDEAASFIHEGESVLVGPNLRFWR